MQVTLAIYVDPGNWSSYESQRDSIETTLKTYGGNNVAGLTGMSDPPLFS